MKRLRYWLGMALTVALLVAGCGETADSSSSARVRSWTDTPATADADESATAEAIDSSNGRSAPTVPTRGEETTTTVVAAAGTREQPVPAGESIRIGDWEVTVLSAVPDATKLIMVENDFNDPPGAGNQFFLVEVAVTYLGEESDVVGAGLAFSAVGDNAIAYDFAASCGVIGDPVEDYTEVFTGGTVQGNLCWEIAAVDADSLVLIVDNWLNIDEERSFLEIPPAGATFDPPPTGVTNHEIEAPYGVGDQVRVGDWELTVLSVTPDATAVVLAENEFNDPPEPDHQFFIVEIAATYAGAESEALVFGTSLTVVGNSAVAYSYESSCGVVPDPVDEWSEVFPGGTVQGNLCWQVTTDDADSLVLIAEPSFEFEEDRVFVDLE